MVFRALIRADVRSEVFQLRRNTDMSMRNIGKTYMVSPGRPSVEFYDAGFSEILVTEKSPDAPQN